MRCNSILQKKDPYSAPEQASRQRQMAPSFFKPWMLLPLALLAILAYLVFARGSRSHAVNALDPGAELTIGDYLQKGKTNIVDFYSDYCPPCKKISPLLRELGRKRPDLAILPVDINRQGVKGIDWASPLARQYELRSIPHFKIYDGDGALLKEGQEAWPEIFALLNAAGIRM
jgi:thiol-disulfide isomerase/thioredoxin